MPDSADSDRETPCPLCADTLMVGICGVELPGGDFCVLRAPRPESTTHVHYGMEDVASDWSPASPCPECLVCKACGSSVGRGLFCQWCGTRNPYNVVIKSHS